MLLFCLPCLNVYIRLNYSLLCVLGYILLSNKFLCEPSDSPSPRRFLPSLISFSLQPLFLSISAAGMLCVVRSCRTPLLTLPPQYVAQRAEQQTCGWVPQYVARRAEQQTCGWVARAEGCHHTRAFLFQQLLIIFAISTPSAFSNFRVHDGLVYCYLLIEYLTC